MSQHTLDQEGNMHLLAIFRPTVADPHVARGLGIGPLFTNPNQRFRPDDSSEQNFHIRAKNERMKLVTDYEDYKTIDALA